jgi:transposase
LLANEGLGNLEIAHTLGCSKDTVGKWRRRYHERGPKALRDQPRSGRPRRFSPEQVSRVLEKATQWPRDNGIPFSHWDSTALAELAVAAGIVESVHPTTIWRWLNEADLKPHRVHHWLKSTDPEFESKMQDVTRLYLAVPHLAKQGIFTFSLDEKTSIQALQRKAPDLPIRPGKPQLTEHEYIRHGTLCLTAAFDVATGQVQSLLTPNRPSSVFASFVRSLLSQDAVSKAPQVHLVMDRLNTHWSLHLCEIVASFSDVPYDPKTLQTGIERRTFLTQADKRVVVHYTPKHASWLNQIEIWFSVLTRKLLARESFSSLAELKERIEQFITYHNRYLAHPYRWTYTGTPCSV